MICSYWACYFWQLTDTQNCTYFLCTSQMSTSKYYVDLFHLSTALSTLSDLSDREAEIYLWKTEIWFWPTSLVWRLHKTHLWNQNVRFRRCKYIEGKQSIWHTKLLWKLWSWVLWYHRNLCAFVWALESIGVECVQRIDIASRWKMTWTCNFCKISRKSCCNKYEREKKTLFTNVSANGENSRCQRTCDFLTWIVAVGQTQSKCQM